MYGSSHLGGGDLFPTAGRGGVSILCNLQCEGSACKPAVPNQACTRNCRRYQNSADNDDLFHEVVAGALQWLIGTKILVALHFSLPECSWTSVVVQ